MNPLPAVVTQLDLTPANRVMAYTVIDQLDAFLSKERWLKGGWFKTDGDGAKNGYHTECLANFIRRVELGGPRLNAHEVDGVGANEKDDDGDEGGNYHQLRSITEGVVAQAIRDLYPGEVRHMHYESHKLEEQGIAFGNMPTEQAKNESYAPGEVLYWQVEPEECTLDHGGRCATCKAERYGDEVTIGLKYGPFKGHEADEVIPSFNDTLGTRYADVQRVIDRAREMISGVPITNAADVMNEQERMEMELASIDAQADIDSERIVAWFGDMEERGWVKRHWTKREAERRVKRIRMRAEKEKEVVRQDCVNCA